MRHKSVLFPSGDWIRGRDQYYPVTSDPIQNREYFGHVIKIYFYAMPRYSKFRRRYRRRAGPAYSVTRKLIKAGAFSRLADSQYYAASAKLCVNPSNLTSDRVGSIVTVKHIEVQLANLPTYFGVNEDQQIKEFGQLGGGWICVYVPEGTSPNKPFPDFGTGQSAYTLYEPNQNVLGSGTWLEGGAYQQTNLRDTVMKAGVVGTYRYSDTPAGNNMRIRVPLSRKLNPGDSIWMIFWVQTPISTLSDVSVEDIALTVSYASRAN